MSRRLGALAVAVVLLAACGGSGAGGYAATELRSGADVAVADLGGEPVVLTSWATWCAECDDLLEALQGFADSPAAADVAVVAVNLDAADNTAEIDAKIAKHSLTTDVWRDRRNEFRSAFGALGVPTSVVLDADGDVVATFPGVVDFAGPEFTAALADAGATP